MSSSAFHQLYQLPDGVKVGDVLPVYRHVIESVQIGSPCSVCAGCRKEFTAARKRRRSIVLFPIAATTPIAIRFDLCGACTRAHRAGGTPRESLLASVQAFAEGQRCDG